MTTFRFLFAPAALALAAAMPALAASSASSASSTASTSIGASSDSIQNSSESSSQQNRTAQGDYRVTDVAVADGKPGMVRVSLQAAEGDESFDLVLPQQAAQAGRVAVGEVVHAAPRPYGVEFARADNRQAFFLVLQDEWYRELATNPV